MNTKPLRYLRKSEVRTRLAASNKTIDELVRTGVLPAPIYFGPRSPRFLESALEAAELRIANDASRGAADAVALTEKARAAYREKAASGEILVKRRATVAAKRAQGVA